MDKKKCFVIMPFSKTTEEHDEAYWTEFFDTIKRIMEEKNYYTTRSEVGPYKLFSNIVENIESSDIVIAILTDFNVNVWYELGIRHTLKSGTIMLLQEGQKVPFDISDFGIIFYKDSIGLEGFVRKEVERYLAKSTDNTCDSPVLYSLNNGVNGSVQKKLEEMQQLIWRLIDEIPKEAGLRKDNKNRKNRILWVDDYPSNNETIIKLFEDRGIQFDIAITTRQGIELFKRELYDLVITDMGRGNESDAGVSLIKELRQLHCQIPIVVFASSRAIKRYGSEALRLGASEVTSGVGNIISIISNILEL